MTTAASVPRPEDMTPEALFNLNRENEVAAGRRVDARLPGLRKILTDMRDSDDPDRLADAAFLLGTFDDMSTCADLILSERNALRADYETAVNRLGKFVSERDVLNAEVERLQAALREASQLIREDNAPSTALLVIDTALLAGGKE